MARGAGKFDDILLSVKRRLIAEVQGANDATCYLCLNPDDTPSPNPGSFFYVISPLSGQFLQGYLDGGGEAQATVDAGVLVRVYSPVMLDQPKRDTVFLTHATRGILERARIVLMALTNWSPMDEAEENELTRDPLIPSGFDIAKHQKSLGYIDVGFRLLFDWDLATEAVEDQ